MNVDAGELDDEAVLRKLCRAQSLMREALALLDEAGTPGDCDSHLDLAIFLNDEEIKRREQTEASSSGDSPWCDRHRTGDAAMPEQ